MRIYTEKFHSMRDIKRLFQREIIRKPKNIINRQLKLKARTLLANKKKNKTKLKIEKK